MNAKILILVTAIFFAGIVNAEDLGNYSSNPYDPESTSNPYGAGNPYDPNSINNPYGRYGSKYSPDSINNPYGAGNPYSPDSPNNPYGSGLEIEGQ